MSAPPPTPPRTLRPSPAIAGMAPYVVPRHPAPVDLVLDGNEGRRPFPDVWQPLATAAPELIRRYPKATSLEEALAAAYELAPDQVLVTSGGDDALDRAARAVLAPGRELILPVPTFEMIGRYATLVGATVLDVPWPDGAYPTDAVIARITDATSAIAIVTPNNPTGGVATADDLRRLAAAAPHALMLVDLAYVEFADVDLTAAALACCPTPRRAHALQGLGPRRPARRLRAGPRAAHPLAARGRGPYPVSGRPPLACRGSTRARTATMRRSSPRSAERDALSAACSRPRREALPSQGNFVFAHVPRAAWLRDASPASASASAPVPGQARARRTPCRITCPGDAARSRPADLMPSPPRSARRPCSSTWTACSPTSRRLPRGHRRPRATSASR
jgi:histidinol-phosphate aminotransferase